MEQRRNIQAGNFFLYKGEIVQVYDVFVGEILQDYKRKNKYCIVNKECEFLACHEEELKNIPLSEEMLKTFFIPSKYKGRIVYFVGGNVVRFELDWNLERNFAEMFSVFQYDGFYIGRVEYVNQLQNIINGLVELGKIHDLNEEGDEIPLEIDNKVKQFLWRENDDRK